MTERSFETNQAVKIWTQVIVRVIAILLAVLAALWLLYNLTTLFLLIILSIFFCYLIAPVVRLFEQPVYIGTREFRLPRSIAILLVYAIIGAALFALVKILWPQLTAQVMELRQNWDAYFKSGSEAANNFISGTNAWMRRLRMPLQWREYVTEHLGELAKNSVPLVESFVAGIIGYLPYLSWLIIVPILSFFFLRDAESFVNTAVAVLPSERLQRRAHWLLLDVSKTLAAYIRAQLTSCLLVGTFATIGLYVLIPQYAAVLGAVVGIFEFVPMAGPFVAACIAFALGLTVSFKTALWIAVFLIILRLAQDYIFYPRIVGHGIKMHPVLVILAIFGGAEVGGLMGVFLAVPVVALGMVIYHHYLAYRGIQKLKVVVPNEEVLEQREMELAVEAKGSE